MPTLMIFAVVLFTLAMILYSTGIWAERLARRLKPWHVRVFFAGVLVDSIATWATWASVGALVFTAHAIAGFISLGLMLFHFVWAMIVVKGGNERAITRFHHFSLIVWTIWMISYLSGFWLGIQKVG